MNLLRFAIVLNGTSSLKFNTVLNQTIIGVLFDNYDKEYSLIDIKKAIQDKYDLDFSNTELLKSIESDSSPFVINQNGGKTLYSLKPQQINKQKKFSSSLDLDKLLETFRKEIIQHDFNVNFNKDNFKQTLNEFFYSVFNSNKEEILTLLSGKKPKSINTTKNLNAEDADYLSRFLEWQNEDKDLLVYSVIKSAYDYCILNLKSDSQESVFTKKQLFLDTNVLFSLMGINGQDKEDATKAFINKCKDIKTELCYTDFTYKECKSTLSSLIDLLSKMVKGQNYINESNFKNFFGKSSQSYLYSLYLQWIKGHPSRIGDFDRFAIHMEIQLTKILDTLIFKSTNNKINEEKESIQTNMQKLEDFKNRMNRHYTHNSILTDVCNYEYIESLRNHSSISINGQKSFFITLDNALISWSSKENGNIISLFVHPSTMYSVILRFSSRTNNDYRAFSNFVSLGLENEFSNKELNDYKAELICEINTLDESEDVKEQILYYSNRMLLEDKTHNIPTEMTAKEVVEKGKESVINQLKEDHKNEKESLKKEKDNAVIKAKQEGIDHAISVQARLKARNTLKRNKIIRFVLLMIVIFIILTLAVLGVIQLINEGVNSLSGWIQIIGATLAIIPFVTPVKKELMKAINKLLPIDFDLLFKKQLKKIKDRYAKEEML